MKKIEIGTIAVDQNKTIKTITLGTLRLKTEYTIELFTSREGDYIAHFHIIPKNRSKSVVCVKLYEAAYFKHGDKDGTLNADECTKLNEFLNKKCTLSENKDFNYNNWQFMVYKWRQSHNEPCSKDIIEKLSKPDYTTITE